MNGGSGREYATNLFWHMTALKLDGFDNYACGRLAAIGSDGASGGQHAQNKLLRLVNCELAFDNLITSIDGERCIKDCIVPSTWFRLLARRPHRFINHLGAREHKVREFWTKLFSSKR